MLTSVTLNSLVDAQLHLKVESFQRGGAFKFRGAYNAVSSLGGDELAGGVCAVSSGNHAQAVALAARLCATHAVILMPSDAPALKRVATKGYGAEVIAFDRYGDDRELLVRELSSRRGLALVHPYDDLRVMAGQGTVALELLEQAAGSRLDVVLVPVGGGGLISGIALYLKSLRPSVQLIGVEPAGADAMTRSLTAGRAVALERLDTIADGLAARAPGRLTFDIAGRHVDRMAVVSDEEILRAIRLYFQWEHLLAEPAGAAALAALLYHYSPRPNERVVVLLSGANVTDDVMLQALRAR